MNKKFIPLLLITTLFFLKRGFSQSPVTVDPLTGAANVVIPIYTINNGLVSLPISLGYNSSGIKPKDVEETAGMGWKVNIGGQIVREVRGLPDDVTQDAYGNNMYGWMSSANSAANSINGFLIQNDGGVTCSKETADISYITTHFPYSYDTEPDIFYVSAPGLSCQLVYDRISSKFHSINYQDLVISWHPDSVGLINSFTIINDKGIKYVFGAPESVRTGTSGGSQTYFSTKFKQYQYYINYNDSWSLTSMTDANGNGILVDYFIPHPYGPDQSKLYHKVGNDPVSLYMPSQTTATLQYNVQQIITPISILDVKTTTLIDTNLVFSFSTTSSASGETIINNIVGMGRNFQLNYSQVTYPSTGYARSFLRGFVDLGCSTPINYQFRYGRETLLPSGFYTTILPDSAGKQVDYWGYYSYNTNSSLMPKVWVNPSNPAYQRYAIYEPLTGGGSYAYSTTNGNNRTAAVANFDAGSLTGITYAQGGTTTIAYEPNIYIDVPSNQVIAGGGIRVKSITDYDGNDLTKNIVHNYSYNDPTTGLTSGKPISLPVFAFTIPYTGTATGSALWNSNTVVSDYDLSNENHTIYYGYFKVSQVGGGSTQYQYYLPATNWDSNAAPACSGCTTEWTPTLNNIARNNCSSVYGPIKNDIFTYPFVPNINYDFERGLVEKVTDLDDNDAKVSEESYTYNRSFNPSVITAFKYDDNSNGALLTKTYNKYSVYYNTSELTTSTVKKVFDSPTVVRTTTVNYAYGSMFHKLLTQQSAINSDNSTTYTKNIQYTKDFAASSGSNANVNAIYYLQQNNINIPVETWNQVTVGGVINTTEASLTLFKGVTKGSNVFYLPSQLFKVIQPNGVSNFAPYIISGQTATRDSRYFLTTNYDTYDNAGFLQTLDDSHKKIQTTITDHITNSPTAIFGNAAYNEIAFSDFDTNAGLLQSFNFNISGTGTSTIGSHAGNAYGLGTTQTISKTISAKNAIAQNYIFSIWINAAVAAGNLNFTLVGGNTSTYTKSFNLGGWTYYEWSLPVNNMSSSFTISVTSSQAIFIDDILFYPDVAQVTTATYDPVTHFKIAETNTNGISEYYQNDQWGRLLFKYDQDKNIIEKRSYVTPDEITQGVTVPTIFSSSTTVLTPATFTANTTPCITRTSYSWNFGDGTTVPSTLDAYSQTHTYSAVGTYTVTVTASNPSLDTKTATTTINITPPPLVPHICTSGVVSWNTCTNSAISTTTCGSNPYDSHTSYFTITSVGGSGYGALSYQWQISYDNGVSWANAGTNSTQMSILCSRASRAYRIRCIVTSTSGQTGTSNYQVFSTPAC